MSTNRPQGAAGSLASGLGAYLAWGVSPLFFRALHGVAPAEVLAHRLVWSAVVALSVLAARRAWPDLLRNLRSPRQLALLGTSALLSGTMALLFVYSVSTGRVLQASLAYFVSPLFSILLGALFLGERLRRGQWAAIALAASGMTYLVIASGEPPWITLTLALTVSLYGLVRKRAGVDSVVGLGAEMLFLLPAAAGFVGYTLASGTASFAQGNHTLDALLLLSGVVTAVPLLLFGRAVRGLRLSTLGVMQYLSPSLQFLLALAVLGEAFRTTQAIGFGSVLAAVLLFAVEAAFAARTSVVAEKSVTMSPVGRTDRLPAVRKGRAVRHLVSR